jgi:hypothetical protein
MQSVRSWTIVLAHLKKTTMSNNLLQAIQQIKRTKQLLALCKWARRPQLSLDMKLYVLTFLDTSDALALLATSMAWNELRHTERGCRHLCRICFNPLTQWQMDVFGFTSQTSWKTIYNVRTQTVNNWKQGKAIVRWIVTNDNIYELSAITGGHIGMRFSNDNHVRVDLVTGQLTPGTKEFCMAEQDPPLSFRDFPPIKSPTQIALFCEQKNLRSVQLLVSRKEFLQSSRYCHALVRYYGSTGCSYSAAFLTRCSPAFCVASQLINNILTVWDFRPQLAVGNDGVIVKRLRLA